MPSLTRTAGRPERDRHREAVELKVLTAVDELLAGGSTFTELAVQRIATEARIARSTFYRYFPDKSRLLIRMAELATGEQFRAAEHWWASSHSDGEAGVVAAMRAMIAGSRAHAHLLRALAEVAAYDPDVGTYWRGRIETFVALVCARLQADRAAGRIPDGVDIPSTAIVLTCMVERSIDFALGSDDVADEQMARSLGRAVWLIVYGTAGDA
ncbi:TetR/AcrR family transcriptional regulator [Nocardia stercoris]|uniref:TetR/AcrR family transcriptional regulator n=1 Tax=Nocardia stercoris TaxID=2483361 RepID=A0A3M2L3W2_9NOCA|nr:TetR/AcrR family transcriptional regulator [Nocardia stercoris]RMI31400.1 TetR/AcrR family transcriptional regulator [Nocardia stercoris]